MDFDQQVRIFLQELTKFRYHFDGDWIWRFVFRDKKEKWHKINIQQYKDTFYISIIDGDFPTLEVAPDKKVGKSEWHKTAHGSSRFDDSVEKYWEPLISSARTWIKRAERDCIKTGALSVANYPINRRKGYVPHSVVRALLPDIYRLDQDLGKRNVAKFIKLHESRYFWNHEKTERSTMTAAIYFEYCRIAYIAAKRKDDHVDEKFSGRQMYKRYADGRHEGLLDIDMDSEEEFGAWIDHKHPKRGGGGHPWEIKRGGNTTHIDLYVSRPRLYNEFPEKGGFVVTINARAIGRLAEAIRMFLALYEADMPITIADADTIARRLLAQDNVGIVPCYDSLHRANQTFPKDQGVHEVMHFDDLGKAKRRIKPFIIWEPLSMLVPFAN